MDVIRKRSTLTREDVLNLREKDKGISHSAFAIKIGVCIDRYYRCLIQEEDLTDEQAAEVRTTEFRNRTEFSRLFPLYHPEISGVVFKGTPHGSTPENIFLKCTKIMDRVGITAEEISDTYNAMKYRKSLNLGYPNDILNMN